MGKSDRRHSSAFTLIELMVVVIIIAVLASSAAPIYIGHARRARLAEGVAGAGAIRSLEFLYYSEHGSYLAVAPENMANEPNANLPGLGLDFSRNAYFDENSFSVSTDASYGFIAAADGSASAAPRAEQVAGYRVEMRSNGQVRHDFGSGWTDWE